MSGGPASTSGGRPPSAPPTGPSQGMPLIGEIHFESTHLTELNEQKAELTSKVQTLKRELHDWRTKLDNQVKSYRVEITDLRRSLNTEVEALRAEFLDLKGALKQQLDLTAGLAAQEAVDAERKAAGLA